MGRVDDIAKRFSLAGVLDEDRQAKQRFPVEEEAGTSKIYRAVKYS